MDNISNSTPSVVLPEHITAAIENARNNVTVLEAESARLSKVAFQYKTDIENLHAEKVDSQAQVDKLKAELDSTVNRLAALKADMITSQEEIDKSKAILDNFTSEMSNKKAELTKKSAELDAREKAVSEAEDISNKKAIDLLARETEHNAKVEKLKKALE